MIDIINNYYVLRAFTIHKINYFTLFTILNYKLLNDKESIYF